MTSEAAFDCVRRPSTGMKYVCRWEYNRALRFVWSFSGTRMKLLSLSINVHLGERYAGIGTVSHR